MGFFNRNKINPNKIYTREEALRILSDSENQGYTTIETVDYRNGNDIGYKIVTQAVADQYIAEINRKKKEKNQLRNELRNNGAYENIKVPRNYNYYQPSRNYQQSEFSR